MIERYTISPPSGSYTTHFPAGKVVHARRIGWNIEVYIDREEGLSGTRTFRTLREWEDPQDGEVLVAVAAQTDPDDPDDDPWFVYEAVEVAS